MFTLLSSAISNTAELLAPTTPSDQQFRWHWNQILLFYENDDKSCLSAPIESTNISLHLEKMCKILCEEQFQESNGETEENGGFESSLGASMEYLLQEKILETLSGLAQTDSPFGLCQQILFFFTSLLKNSSLELLPHKSVYTSVQKLIIICGKLIAGPYESTEVQFLSCICEQIQRNPDLINCFLNESFPLISALLALLQSPDQEISTKSGDALIRLISAVNERGEQIITFETPFCSKIVDQMVCLYQSIPRSLRPEQMENAINTCFGTEDNSQTFEAFSPSVRKFLCFLRWFVFFDMIVNHLPNNESVLMKTILNEFKTDFLESCICPDLLGIGYTDESDAGEHIFLTTVLLSNCLRNIVSPQLSKTIGEFLLIDTKSDLMIETQRFGSNDNKLKNILLERCLLIDPNKCQSDVCPTDPTSESKRIQLCMSSMQLFEDILLKPSVAILNDLVINFLRERTYLDESVLMTTESNLDSNDFEDLIPIVRSDSTSHSEDVSIGSKPHFNYVSTSHVQKILQIFTLLVPDELKSSQSNDEMEYETYVREAQKHFEGIASVCRKWKDWTTDTKTCVEHTVIDMNGAQNNHNVFFEGPFLAMIFDNLEYMVKLPYEVNLQVTSLISRLALFPHKILNEYLLDPTIPLVKGSRSLFSILHKLVDELQVSVKGLIGLKHKLQMTRKTLLGENDRSVEELNLEFDEKTTRILEALIVIEEFCKELAALSFVKYHNTF